jgi:hypothetical protein
MYPRCLITAPTSSGFGADGLPVTGSCGRPMEPVPSLDSGDQEWVPDVGGQMIYAVMPTRAKTTPVIGTCVAKMTPLEHMTPTWSDAP